MTSKFRKLWEYSKLHPFQTHFQSLPSPGKNYMLFLLSSHSSKVLFVLYTVVHKQASTSYFVCMFSRQKVTNCDTLINKISTYLFEKPNNFYYEIFFPYFLLSIFITIWLYNTAGNYKPVCFWWWLFSSDVCNKTI